MVFVDPDARQESAPVSIETWIAFALASALVVLIPGPNIVLTVNHAIRHGKRSGLATGPGVTVGAFVAMSVSLLGAGAVLATSVFLFTLLKLAGAAYLLWLAYGLWTAPSDGLVQTGEAAQRPLRSVFWQAVLVSGLNPKGPAFYIAFLPQFVVAEAGNVTAQMLLLGGVFSAMTAAVFLIYAFFASVARRKVLESTRVMTWIRRAFALSFGGLAMRVALDRS